MGIHSGPVTAIVDVNGKSNVAGAGINMAQRVTDCGDAGHILLSKRAAEDLEHYPQWKPLLHDLGEYQVKHGILMHLVNLYSESAGNPVAPRNSNVANPQKAEAALVDLFRSLSQNEQAILTLLAESDFGLTEGQLCESIRVPPQQFLHFIDRLVDNLGLAERTEPESGGAFWALSEKGRAVAAANSLFRGGIEVGGE